MRFLRHIVRNWSLPQNAGTVGQFGTYGRVDDESRGMIVVMATRADQGETWRVSTVQRVAWVVVLLGWLALTLGITIARNKTPGAGASPTILLWILFALVALSAWRCGFVPYIDATDTELDIRNPFTRKRIPWNEIKTIKPGSMGLIIVTRQDGFPKTGWAVQKSRAGRWVKAKSRADEVTAVLMERIRAAGS